MMPQPSRTRWGMYGITFAVWERDSARMAVRNAVHVEVAVHGQRFTRSGLASGVQRPVHIRQEERVRLQLVHGMKTHPHPLARSPFCEDLHHERGQVGCSGQLLERGCGHNILSLPQPL